jgi:hypothetical protein
LKRWLKSYDKQIKQVQAMVKGDLMLNGFTFFVTGRFELAPDRVPEQMKRKESWNIPTI